MKNTSVSLFRQVLDLIPKREFEEIVMKYDGDKRKQSFDCWAHFVSMIFCQGSVRYIAQICFIQRTYRCKSELTVAVAAGLCESF